VNRAGGMFWNLLQTGYFRSTLSRTYHDVLDDEACSALDAMKRHFIISLPVMMLIQPTVREVSEISMPNAFAGSDGQLASNITRPAIASAKAYSELALASDSLGGNPYSLGARSHLSQFRFHISSRYPRMETPNRPTSGA
jgi:hypothetical protein